MDTAKFRSQKGAKPATPRERWRGWKVKYFQNPIIYKGRGN
jgi:hypothetical protein